MRSTLLALAALTAAPLPATTNGDFESTNEIGGPAAWSTLRRDGSDSGASLTLIDGPAGKALHFDAEGLDPMAWSRLCQAIDAAPWRGKVVRLSARMRVIEPGFHVGLRLKVTRPAPFDQGGFYDHMTERPISQGDWREVAIVGFVDADALTIDLGAMVQGRAVFDIDDVRLQEFVAPAEPASAAAQAYLNRALELFRTKHMDAGRLDWPEVTSRANRMIAGAQAPADTYPAIRGVIGTLGDNHTILIPPAPIRTETQSADPGRRAPSPPMPEYSLVDGRFGKLTLPGLVYSWQERWIGLRYVGAIQEGLRTLDDKPLCGWIVDLRGNTGGNMWPMLNALGPLLGPGPYGRFIGADGTTAPWVRRDGFVVIEGASAENMGLADMRPVTIRQAELPVAVLIGPNTGSSGEQTALALIGRPGVRTFGAPSAGFLTANASFPLSDGAILAIPGGWSSDRLGREYRNRITPDEPADEPLDNAKAWLGGTCTAGAN